MLQQTTNRRHSGPPTLSLQQDWEAGVPAPILQRKTKAKRLSNLPKTTDLDGAELFKLRKAVLIAEFCTLNHHTIIL